MYLLRSVLTSNGVILVSIDDRELDNLQMTMNSAFAEENFVAIFVRKRRMATGMRGEPISPDHEYLVTYASSAPQMKLYGNVRTEADYPFQDSKGKYRSTDLTVGMTKVMRPNQFFPIRNPRTGAEYLPPDSRVWRFQPSTMQSFIVSGNIIWPDDYPDKGLSRPRFKTRFVQKETGGRAIPVSTWIDSKKVENHSSATGVLALSAGMNQEGTKELRDLLGSQLLDVSQTCIAAENRCLANYNRR